jgi:hypothetical protein
MIIHGVPNLSVSIANFAAKKVSPGGTATVALSASALKMRSASAGFLVLT